MLIGMKDSMNVLSAVNLFMNVIGNPQNWKRNFALSAVLLKKKNERNFLNGLERKNQRRDKTY